MKTIDTVLGAVPEEDFEKWSSLVDCMELLMPYFLNTKVTGIMVNRYDRIYIENDDGAKKVPEEFESEEKLQQLIDQIAIVTGQHYDQLGILSVRFPDNSQICCTKPSVTSRGSTITIRCAPRRFFSIDDLIECRTLTTEMAEFLKDEVRRKSNIIVSGSSVSGKTTVLQALMEFIPAADRILTCEHSNELYIDLPNLVSMETSEAECSNVGLSTLIENSFYLRPDRVVVGEIEDADASNAFLHLANSGQGGCCTTIRAKSPADALKRIQYNLLKRGMANFEMAGTEVRQSVDIIVQVALEEAGRRVTDISHINDEGKIEKIFEYQKDTDKHDFRLKSWGEVVSYQKYKDQYAIEYI